MKRSKPLKILVKKVKAKWQKFHAVSELVEIKPTMPAQRRPIWIVPGEKLPQESDIIQKEMQKVIIKVTFKRKQT